MTKQYRVTYEREESADSWVKRSTDVFDSLSLAKISADEKRTGNRAFLFRNITIESREVSDWAKEAE